MRSTKLAVLLSLALLFVGATLRSHVSNADSPKPSIPPLLRMVKATPNPWLVADGESQLQIRGSLRMV